MRIISIDSVVGSEILAKDIVNSRGSVLMPAGTKLKKVYVERLRDLEVEFIYIEDEISQGINLMESLEFQIKEECLDTVKNILLKYSYDDNSKQEEIRGLANKIIIDVMDEPEVVYNLSTIRSRSDSIYSHSINVCAISVIIALRLKLSQKKIKEIAIGCLLHDIGFTFMSMDYGDLNLEAVTEKQMKEIKKHVIYGYSAIKKMDWLSPTSKDIMMKHHERIDGTGFPFRLRDKEIDIGVRIASVCDHFDNLVYGNCTEKLKVHQAIDYIVSQAGFEFDFDVVDVFVESVAAYPIGEMVITNQKEIGIVLRQNPKSPTRPIIRIIKDKDGNKPSQLTEKDLIKELTLFIEAAI